MPEIVPSLDVVKNIRSRLDARLGRHTSTLGGPHIGPIGDPFGIGRCGGEVSLQVIAGSSLRFPDGLVRQRRRRGTPHKPARRMRWATRLRPHRSTA